MVLTQYEQLCETAYAQFIDILEYALPDRVRGLYYEDEFYKTITINRCVDTEAEKLCILAEEIGHSIFGGGNLLTNAARTLCASFERKARAWAYKHLLPAKKLIAVLKDEYYHNNWEIAEEFNITIEFLEEAIEYYKTTGAIPMWNNWDNNEFA